MFSIAQTVTELASSPSAPTIVGMINLAAIAAVSIQNWLNRSVVEHEIGQVQKDMLERTGKNAGKIGLLQATTPNRGECVKQYRLLDQTIRAENDELIEKMTALTVGRNGMVANVEVRVRDLEYWRSAQVAKEEADK